MNLQIKSVTGKRNQTMNTYCTKDISNYDHKYMCGRFHEMLCVTLLVNEEEKAFDKAVGNKSHYNSYFL